MAEGAKAVVLERLADQGFSNSYGSLLFLAALVGTDTEQLDPKSDEERFEWRGHVKGLQSALLCVAMYEHGLDPELAGLVVMTHVDEAMAIISMSGRAGSGGESCPTGP